MPKARDIATVLALGAGQIVAFASSFYLLGVLGDPIARSLKVAPSLLFGLMSAAFLVSAFAGPLVGRWLNQRGGREVSLAASLVFGTALMTIGLSPGATTMAGGMLLLGAGMAIGLYGTPNALLVEIHGERARPWIVAVALMGGLGSSVGWVVGAWLLREVGWRGACLTWAGVHLGLCLPLTALLAPRHRVVVQRPDVGERRPPLPFDRRLFQVAVLLAGAWFVSTCMSAHLPRLLERIGLTPQAAVGAAALLGLAAISARALELTLLRRLPPLATTRVATLLHPLGAATVLALGPHAGPALVVAQGLGNGLLSVASGTLPLALFGRENYAWRSALLTTPAKFAQAMGPGVFSLALGASPTLALSLTSGVCLLMFAMTFGLAARAAPASGGDAEPTADRAAETMAGYHR